MSVEGGLELRRDNLLVTHIGPASIQSLPPGNGSAWQEETAFTARTRAELAPASFTMVSAEVSAGSEALQSPYHGSPSRGVLAASVADELYLGRTLTIAPALRWDRVGAFTGLSPRLGLAYRPWAFLELRTSAGRTFRAPSFGELYLEQGPVHPNPALRPEQGSMLEAGAVLRFGAVRVQVVGFTSRITDAISYEEGGGVVTPHNFPGAEIDGGELEAVVHPLPFATLTALYGLARTRNLANDARYIGKELPFRPAERAGIRAEARRGWLEGFAEYGWQSSQYTNRTNRGLLPCQRTARLGAGARVAEAPWEVWASAEVDDLLDQPLIDELGFPQPGRAFFFTLRTTPSGAGENRWSPP
jgi:outer membrane receptor protein involved in Fe transport